MIRLASITPFPRVLICMTSGFLLSPLTVLAQEETSNTLEEIIVIGEKAERSLWDTASSTSVITADTLNTMQYKSLTDAAADIPNVVALSGALPDIRGVSGNGSAGGFNSISGGAKGRTSILIDGVAEPFVADLTGDSGIWDIEQVEVYRGPQSTSNGRNSIAGSMYIKTYDPNFNWEGAARLGYRTEEGYVDTSFMLTGPIAEDTLAFRISAQHVDAETITDDTGFATNPANYDLNEITTDRVRAKLLWSPSDDFQAMLSFSGYDEQGDTGRVFYDASNVEAYDRIWFRNISNEADTTSLNIDYRISNSISFDAVVAVMDYQWGFESYEATVGAQQYLAFDENNLTVDAKVNFGQDNPGLNGFVGLYYFERDNIVDSTGAYIYGGDDTSDSIGIYGEVDVVLNDAWSMIVGGRIERESQTRDFTYGALNAQLDQSKTVTLPKLVLQYDFSDETTFTLSARKGYNAAGGALNFAAQEYYYFDAETVLTYEAGVRSLLADDVFTLSANAFLNNYDGYQALSSTRFITNLEDVQTYGLELELLVKPSSALEFRAGLGLLNTDIKNAGAGFAAADGNELNSAPAITANIGTNYWFTHSFNLGVSINYVDEYYGDFANSNERVAGDYSVVRLNANYQTDHWSLAAFVNNALDEDALVTREPPGRGAPNGYVAIVDPRNIGMSITYRF